MEVPFSTKFFAIVSITLLAVGVIALSFFVLSHQSLRLDESQTLWQTNHSPATIVSVVAEDVHVPLYHFILYVWQLIFGTSVSGARTISLVFFIVTLPAVYVLGEFVYGRTTALYATLLMALSPFMNWYGNEIRMYSLLALLAIINHYFFIRLFKQETEGAWIAYTLSAVLGIYTHYFFFFILLSQLVFYFFHRHIFPPGALKKFIFIAVLVALSIGPWLWYVHVLGNFSNTKPVLAAPTSVDIFNAFSQFLFGFQTDAVNTILVSLWPLLILLAFLSLRKRNVVSSSTLYLLYSLVVPIIASLIFSFTVSPIYLSRYLIIVTPSMYLLTAWLFSTYPRIIANTCRFALVALMVFSLTTEIAAANTPVKEEYSQVATYLEQHAGPADVVAVSTPFTIYPLEYYYRGTADLDTLPRWNRLAFGPIPAFSPEELTTDVAALIANHQNIWVVLSYDQGYEKKIKDYFDTHFQRLDSQTFSPGLSLYEYKIYYP